MKKVEIDAAKPELNTLVDEAIAGEETFLAKHGKPVVRLAPIKDKIRRQPGAMKGQIWMSDDFDAPLPPDLTRAFGAEE